MSAWSKKLMPTSSAVSTKACASRSSSLVRADRPPRPMQPAARTDASMSVCGIRRVFMDGGNVQQRASSAAGGKLVPCASPSQAAPVDETGPVPLLSGIAADTCPRVTEIQCILLERYGVLVRREHDGSG